MSLRPSTSIALALALSTAMIGVQGTVLAPMALAKADSATTDETFKRAEQMFTQRKFRDAAIELKNVLRDNPDHAGARLILGKISLIGGDLETAEKEIGRAHRLAPNDETSVLLGEIALQRGKPTEALAALGEGAQTTDMQIQKLVIAGAALVELKRLDEAEQQHRDILAIDPSRVEGHFGLARVFAARSDYTAATDKIDEIVRGKPDYAPGWILRGEVSLVMGDKHAAFLSFDKAVELQPNEIGPLISRSRAYLANGDIEGARGDSKRVARIMPDAPIRHYLDAAIAFAEGDYETANNSFTHLQRSFDNFAPAVMLGALIKTQRGELNQADALFLRYIAMQPDSLDARRALASVRLRNGQPSNAVDILEKLLKETPDDIGTRRRLASAYLALDRYDEAARHFQAVAETGSGADAQQAGNALILLDPASAKANPELADPAVRVALLKASDALWGGDADAAEAALEALKGPATQSASVLALRGGIASTRGQRDTAKTHLDAALAVNPELVAAHAAYEALDSIPASAVARLERLLQTSPNSEFLSLRLAQRLTETGRTDAALRVMGEQTTRLPASTVLSGAYIRTLVLSGRIEEAAKEATRLSTIPDVPLGRLAFAATTLMDAGAGQAAVAAADRLVARAPESPRAIIVKAEAMASAGQEQAAYDVLRKALKRWPDEVSVAGTLATLAIERRDTAVAQEAAQAIARSNPGASARLLAHAAGELGQPVVAVDVLEKSFSRSPDSRTAIALFGARKRAGRTDAAFAGLSGWVADNPRDRSATMAYATALMEQASYAEAETVYAAFLKLEPGNPVALNNYAWLRHKARRPDALDYAERAFDAAGGSPEVADTYGWMLVEYGKLEQGLSLLARAAKAAPDNPEIGYHYAAALSKAGRATEARTILTGVLDTSGKFDKRGEAENLLSTLR
jgi:putative PEP-CTERM system TPR-repeat lipoprotein